MPRKTQRRRETRSHKTRRHQKRAQKTKKKRAHRRYKGGNYAKDVTINNIDGFPVKKGVVVTVPGYGTMSGEAYKQLKADVDRNGDHLYD